MPNVTCVEYSFGLRRRFAITSQAVPIAQDDTLVYTDLTYDYGPWTRLVRWPLGWLARRIIAQDQAVLAAHLGHACDNRTPALQRSWGQVKGTYR